jgi:hypothetical protein
MTCSKLKPGPLRLHFFLEYWIHLCIYTSSDIVYESIRCGQKRTIEICLNGLIRKKQHKDINQDFAAVLAWRLHYTTQGQFPES